MTTAQLVALEIRLECERGLRDREGALALRLIEQLKRRNAETIKSAAERGATS